MANLCVYVMEFPVLSFCFSHPLAGEGSCEPAFAAHLLGSLGRGASSCKELQEAAASMVVESGGSCSPWEILLANFLYIDVLGFDLKIKNKLYLLFFFEAPVLGALTKKIAKAGGQGKHPQNIERDLMRALELPIDTWVFLMLNILICWFPCLLEYASQTCLFFLYGPRIRTCTGYKYQ